TPVAARRSESESSKSAATTSAPRAASARAAVPAGLRVMARTEWPPSSSARATAPPWVPVAPLTRICPCIVRPSIRFVRAIVRNTSIARTIPDRIDAMEDGERDLVWMELQTAAAVLDSELNTRLEAEAGMSSTDFQALWTLANAPEGSVTMSSLAAQLSMSASGTTRLGDRLVRRGWAKRRRSEERRVGREW